jgi:hypothetical protein
MENVNKNSIKSQLSLVSYQWVHTSTRRPISFQTLDIRISADSQASPIRILSSWTFLGIGKGEEQTFSLTHPLQEDEEI